jgi:hypothetical protein
VARLARSAQPPAPCAAKGSVRLDQMGCDRLRAAAAGKEKHMRRYELCIDTDAPGNGETYGSLEEAKVAGFSAIGHADGDTPMQALADPPLERFFTVHETGSEGEPPVMIFDSRNSYADA